MAHDRRLLSRHQELLAERHNLTAIVPPVVTDDETDFYSPGSVWIDTTTNTIYICANATTGAAVWTTVAEVIANEAAIDPTVNDDLAAGYPVGSLWINTTTKSFFVSVDSSAGAAIWNELPHNNLIAVTAPGAGDDVDDGYDVGSVWIDTATNIIYQCVDATAAAAIWIRIAASIESAAAPTVGDDIGDGYNVGSTWTDTTLNERWVCVDNSTGAAIWVRVATCNNAAADPTANSDIDAGYTVGTTWTNTATGSVFVCTDNSDGAAIWEIMTPAHGASPYSRWQDDRWSMKAGDRDVLVSPATGFEVWINGVRYIKSTSSEYNLAAEATWDTTAGTDYRTASNRAGVNFYIYACAPSSGYVPDIKISVNSTNPTGYTTSTSRKIGGFHCVPANMTSLPGGHDFISHVQGDIHCGDGRSGSIWDLLHRPKGIAAPEGMTWCEEANVWVMIYLISGTGVSTASVNGGTISDTRDWMDFVDDLGSIGCRMPTDREFQLFAAGSNEETNITGSADPGTTGHHLDTAGRSMISNCGCLDCCGVVYQWLSDQSFRVDGLTDPTVDPAWEWYNLPGAKGSLYKQGTYGDVKLPAGGSWSNGPSCGSRCRNASRYRWYASSAIGARAVVESA